MGESGKKEPQRPTPPNSAKNLPRKPLQVMHISRKTGNEPGGKSSLKKEPKGLEISKPKDLDESIKGQTIDDINELNSLKSPNQEISSKEESPITMDDFLLKNNSRIEDKVFTPNNYENNFPDRSLDDFDFDEDEFLAALNENEPVGNTGEIAKGEVIAVESDGVYVDIGGKAPGFMPKTECGLGVITNLKEKFPKGLSVEVLVTREQNADGMVTISCRALALRKSWQSVQSLEKEGKSVQVKINGFNRGGVTCDLEGLRGFIPRSQLTNGENHESLVGKTIGVAFLEVNPDNRKLVLSEKKGQIIAKFSELKIGQLIEGTVQAIKPYGFFIDLGGVSGLLHHSMITNGQIRSLREIFNQGEIIKALITDIDPRRGRIGLNTGLLEGLPGELLSDKAKVMAEADERSIKAKKIIEEKEKANEMEKDRNKSPNTENSQGK